MIAFPISNLIIISIFSNDDNDTILMNIYIYMYHHHIPSSSIGRWDMIQYYMYVYIYPMIILIQYSIFYSMYIPFIPMILIQYIYVYIPSSNDFCRLSAVASTRTHLPVGGLGTTMRRSKGLENPTPRKEKTPRKTGEKLGKSWEKKWENLWIFQI